MKKQVLIALATLMIFVCACNSHKMKEQAIMDNITTRTPVQHFLDKPIEEAKIEQLLRAAMAAPSAMDKQPWHFVVVTDKEQLSALANANLAYEATMTMEAPLAIVVCGNLNKASVSSGGCREYWTQDCSAATENILLAAHAMGLGTLWTGNYPSEERREKVAQILQLPKGVIPFNTIFIGYPESNCEVKDHWDPSNISYNHYSRPEGQEKALEQQLDEKLFTEFDYTDDFRGNPFTWFKGNGLLLAVGDKENHNAMTIGWGSLGNVWSYDVNTITVYVAPARYTHQFMEKYQYFTVMTFDDEQKEILSYMGSHSGRDGDKGAALGLHIAYTEHGAPYYLEAKEVYECEIIYRDPFNPDGFGEIPRKRYENFPAGIHSMYIGKIMSAKRR